jgi:hypothetical protein
MTYLDEDLGFAYRGDDYLVLRLSWDILMFLMSAIVNNVGDPAL